MTEHPTAPDAEDLSHLEPVPRLTGLVGLVAQAGSLLEITAHGLHTEAVHIGRWQPFPRDPGTQQLLDECRPAIRNLLPKRDDAIRVAGLDAVAAAVEANRDRNRVVHGIWIFEDERLKNWQERKNGTQVDAFTLEEIVGIVRRIGRADIRLNSLTRLLFEKRAFPDNDSDGWRDDREEHLAILEGRFWLRGLRNFELMPSD